MKAKEEEEMNKETMIKTKRENRGKIEKNI